jgi:hypothetical protein
MLWYGYVYYIVFNIFLISSVFFLLRVYMWNSLSQLNSLNYLNRFFLSSVLFLFFITFTTLNYLLDGYQDLIYLESLTDSSANISIVSPLLVSKLLAVNSISFNLVQVYYYPFIYVFLLVTVLSVVFCLTYNTDELMTFMFYCLVILAAGCVWFCYCWEDSS